MFKIFKEKTPPVLKEHGELFTEEEYTSVKSYLHSSDANWSYTGFTSKNDGTRFWYCKLDDVPLFTEECQKRIREQVKDLGSLRTVYANGQTTNQPGKWHIDGYSGTTVLWYLDTFPDSWGGKTLFRTVQSIHSFSPKKNTLISFPANVMHRSESPSVKCNILRVSVAWKFE